jgi:hypothetical protein
MALANYTDLQNSIANWLVRSDLTAVIPDFVYLCESDFLSGGTATRQALRVAQMEQNNAALTCSAQFTALPADYIEMRALRLVSPDPGRRLELATPDYITAHWPLTTDNGRPEVFAVAGSQLMVGPPPDTTYTLAIDYYNFVRLSVAPTNWMLTSFPSVYLFGSLKYAALHLRNDEKAANWGDLYERALAGVIDADHTARYPLGQLVAKPAGATP